MPARIQGNFAYYSNPQEWAAAMSAYNGTGPYPAMEPTAPVPTPVAGFNWQAPQFTPAGGGPTFTAPPSAVPPIVPPPPGAQPSVPPPPGAQPSAGGGSPPGAQPPAGGGSPPVLQSPGGADNRPWWMKVDNQRLMDLLHGNPSLRATIPASIILGFPNDFFLQNPQFQGILPPDRRATFGTGALLPSGAATTPPVAAAPPGTPIRDEQASWIVHNPGGLPTLMSPSGESKTVTPRVGQAIAGGPLAPLQALGNLPFFSAQSLANMPPTERQALGVLANETGNFANDFFAQSQRLSSQVGGGGGGGYAGAPRRRY